MQEIVNDSAYKEWLDEQIGLSNTFWISPLQKDNYSEYKLNWLPIIDHTGINDFAFWPSNQPQWDAIGISGDTLVLVEAKSHPGELNSKMSARSPHSIDLIIRSMREVFDATYNNGSFEKWTDSYYQLGNRLTFIYKLNQNIKPGKIKRVVLVLLNIVNDPTLEKDHKSISLAEWQSHYIKVLKEMTGQTEITSTDIKLVYFDVKGEENKCYLKKDSI